MPMTIQHEWDSFIPFDLHQWNTASDKERERIIFYSGAAAAMALVDQIGNADVSMQARGLMAQGLYYEVLDVLDPVNTPTSPNEKH